MDTFKAGSFVWWAERSLRVSENTKLRGVFGPKTEKVTGEICNKMKED
jgi:hypothetical protein